MGNYYRFFKPLIPGVPTEILEEDNWEELWAKGNSEEVAKTLLINTGVLECITMVKSMKFDITNRRIMARFNNNVVAEIISPLTPETVKEVTRNPVKVRIYIRSKHVEAWIMKVYGGLYDVKEFIEEAGDQLLKALIEGYGYEYNEKTLRVMLPRILALFRVSTMPIYLFQVTPPNTGKTFYLLRNRTAFNWAYTSEVPSLAYLVWNARDNFPGVVYYRDGIGFDGVDKWSLQPFRISKDYELLLTGMEQGVWGRGVASPMPEIKKPLNMVFMGNVDTAPMRRVPDRVIAMEMMRPLFKPEVFFDRIHLVDTYYESVNVQKYIRNTALPDAMIRGVIEVLSENANRQTGYSSLTGRMARHSVALQKIFKTLGLDIPGEIVDEMVENGVSYVWEKLYPHLQSQEK